MNHGDLNAKLDASHPGHHNTNLGASVQGGMSLVLETWLSLVKIVTAAVSDRQRGPGGSVFEVERSGSAPVLRWTPT